MINTKFKSADPTTSLQALWVEVENADKIKFAEIADLRVKVKTLEDARIVQIKLNTQFRDAIGKLNRKTQPERKFKWPWQ